MSDNSCSLHKDGITLTDGSGGGNTVELKMDSSGNASLSGNNLDITINNLELSGDLTVSGTTTTVSSTVLEVSDTLIHLGDGNSSNGTALGFYGEYVNNGETATRYAGLFKDTSNDWRFFKSNAADLPSVNDIDPANDNDYEKAKVIADFSDGTATLSGGNLTDATNVTASGTISGGTLTDGDATLTGGELSVTNVDASGTVTADSFTDGDATITNGALSGVTNIEASGEISSNTLDVTSNTTVGGTLGVTGNTTVGGTFGVTGNTTVGGTLGVTGATTLTDALNANGGIFCDTDKFTVANTTGNTSVGGTLAVSGASTLNGNVTINGSDGLTVSSGHLTLGTGQYLKGQTGDPDNYENVFGAQFKAFGLFYAHDNFLVHDIDTSTNTFTIDNSTGNTSVGGTLGVTGATTLSSTLAVTSNASVGGTLGATGATTLSNTLDVSGATTLSDTLGVTKATTLSDTLSVSGTTTLSDTLGVTKATTLSDTLGVTGATTLSSTLSVSGNSTLSGNASVGGTLGVTGATTLSYTLGVTGATTLSDTLSVSGNSTLSGNASVGGTLGATGATTLSDTLGVTGATTLSSTLGVTGATTLSDKLIVSGNSTLSGNASVGGTLGVTGATTLSDELNVTGNTTLSYLEVDNLKMDSNTISSKTGNINITPITGSKIFLDTDISVDGGVITGATSISSTSFTGNLSGNITSTGNSSFTDVDITGGSINDTPIGDTSASTGSFTTLKTSDDCNFRGVFAIASNGIGVSVPIVSSNALTNTGTFSTNNGSFIVNSNGKGIFASDLDVNGTLTVDGELSANAYTATSDRNLKENIKELEDSLDTISKIQGYEFNYKKTGKLSKGVIAQEVEEILPSAVTTNDSGIKSVDYLQFIPYLIESVKELKSEIETLKSA